MKNKDFSISTANMSYGFYRTYLHPMIINGSDEEEIHNIKLAHTRVHTLFTADPGLSETQKMFVSSFLNGDIIFCKKTSPQICQSIPLIEHITNILFFKNILNSEDWYWDWEHTTYIIMQTLTELQIKNENAMGQKEAHIILKDVRIKLRKYSTHIEHLNAVRGYGRIVRWLTLLNE